MEALGQVHLLWLPMQQAASSLQRYSWQTSELLTCASHAGMRYSHFYSHPSSFSPMRCR